MENPTHLMMFLLFVMGAQSMEKKDLDLILEGYGRNGRKNASIKLNPFDTNSIQ
jgi:hypothetical protein